MPEKASQFLDELGVKQERRTFEYAALGKDLEYGVDARQFDRPRVTKWESLFPPLAGMDEAEDPLQKSKPRQKLSKKLREITDQLAEEAGAEAETSKTEKKE